MPEDAARGSKGIQPDEDRDYSLRNFPYTIGHSWLWNDPAFVGCVIAILDRADALKLTCIEVSALQSLLAHEQDDVYISLEDRKMAYALVARYWEKPPAN